MDDKNAAVEAQNATPEAVWTTRKLFRNAIQTGMTPEQVHSEVAAMRHLATDERRSRSEADARGKALAERMFKAQQDWGVSNQELADLLGLDKGTVSHYLSGVRTFRDSTFYEVATVTHLRKANKAMRTYSGSLRKTVTPDHILGRVIAGDEVRAIKRAACELMHNKQSALAAQRLQELRTTSSPILNSCWLGDACDLAQDERIKGKVDLIFWDPPYFGMRRGGHGVHSNGRADYNGLAMHSEEYCTDYKQVIDHHYRFLEMSRVALAPEGRLLWFLSSLSVTDMEFYRLMLRARELGWECNVPYLHWLKSKPNVCNLDAMHSHQDEIIIVLNRSADPANPRYPQDFWPYDRQLPDGSYSGGLAKFSAIHDKKSNFIPIASLTQNLAGHIGALADYDQDWDAWEKPPELGEYLAINAAAPGSLVWDACGCTGSLTIGAMRARMNWIYSERSEEKYAEGVRRIDRAKEELGTSQ